MTAVISHIQLTASLLLRTSVPITVSDKSNPSRLVRICLAATNAQRPSSVYILGSVTKKKTSAIREREGLNEDDKQRRGRRERLIPYSQVLY